MFNIDLVDKLGSTIQATFFKEAVDRYENYILEGRVYLMCNGNIKASNQKFTNIVNSFSIAFDKQSVVKELENGLN